MDAQKKIIERLQTANNVLVTVSANPNVDQLAACIGLTLALNKQDKHSTAVFSGDVPDTIEFLKPERTLEKSADSLRDFIISLDKSKADKLRYKVEDKVVKIFITPYRTSLSEEDLYFSQGDYNVDVVMALGVVEQRDLDQAITAHGRILHDATVISINNGDSKSEIGSINWQDSQASSLSEMTTALVKQLGKKTLDEQIATALLTGVVAETDRFRNHKTTAQSLSISADLMSAGANQQLITSQLDHTLNVQSAGSEDKETQSDKSNKKPSLPEKDDGTMGALEVEHDSGESKEESNTKPPMDEGSKNKQSEPDLPLPPPSPDTEGNLPQIHKVHSLPDENKEPQPYAYDRKESYAKSAAEEAAFNSNPANDYTEDGDIEGATSLKPPDHKLLSHDSALGQPPAEAKPVEQPSDNGSLDVPPAPAPAPPPPPSFDEQSSQEKPPSGKGMDDYLPLKSEPLPSQATADTEKPAPPSVPPSQDIDSTPKGSEETSPPSPQADVEAARSEVLKALNEQPSDNLPPVERLNAQDLGGGLHEGQAESSPPAAPGAPPRQDLSESGEQSPEEFAPPSGQPLDMPPPSSPPGPPQSNDQPPQGSPKPPPGQGPSPPPVPPPMMPPPQR